MKSAVPPKTLAFLGLAVAMATMPACDPEPVTEDTRVSDLEVAPPPVTPEFDAALLAAVEAEAVFSGEVVEIRHSVSDPDADGVRLPFTLVTWVVDDAIKGVEPGSDYTARFLGGPMGDSYLEVSEIPEFSMGDLDLVFIQGNGEVGNPLVGGAKGRIQIESADGKGDGLSLRAPDRHWVEDLATHLREVGVGDDAAPSSPALDAPFVFDLPRPATTEQRREAARRASTTRLAASPAATDDPEIAALQANDFNPVLPR